MPLFKNDFKTVRWTRAISLAVQLALGASLLLGLNHLASKHFVRKDLTQNRQYSLSPESLAYLNQLQKPVEVFVTIPSHSLKKESNEIYKQVKSLLREYEYATRNNEVGTIKAEFINPYEQNSRAQEIANRFGTHTENAIIISSGDQHRHIQGGELYEFKNGEITSFKGERAFTSAVLDVSRDQQDVVYFLSGHGEMRFNDVDPLRGLSQAAQTLLNHNLKLVQLDLSQKNEIPEDASLLILASPQAPLLPNEIGALERYLNEGSGSLLVFLEPGKKHGLDELFYQWGIRADDMVVMDSGKDFQSNGGDLIIRTFAQHPITQFLIDYQLTTLAGLSRPVRPDPTARADARQIVMPLMAGSDKSWGIFDYNNTDKKSINPETDLAGPVPIATLSERNGSSQLGITIPGGRLIVFGNSDFITNNRLSSLGNMVLLQNSVNWCLERAELLNIPPKPLEKFQLPLSQDDLIHIALGLSLVPAIIGCFGIFVHSVRKH